MKRIVVFLLNLFLSSIIATFLSIVVFTLSEFIALDLNIHETSSYFTFSYLFLFVIFMVTVITWIKYKSQVTFIVFILIIIGLYGAGKIYAHKLIKPFIKAEEYRKEAYLIYEKWTNRSIKPEEVDEYLREQEFALNLLRSTIKLNFGYEPWIKKYYQNIYEVKKEIYDFDKKSLKRTEQFSEDKIKELFDSYTKKLNENYYIKPFWMDFYFVDPT